MHFFPENENEIMGAALVTTGASFFTEDIKRKIKKGLKIK
jgi:hypothetical protein